MTNMHDGQSIFFGAGEGISVAAWRLLLVIILSWLCTGEESSRDLGAVVSQYHMAG